MNLSALLAIDSADRLSALEDLDPKDPNAMYAVRDLALRDEDATVRAHATAFLGRCDHDAAEGAILDALYDTHPSVRMNAALALKKFDPQLTRAALEEPIWWVRRAAILSLARIEKKAAIPTLRAALDDPFWRVRHAAVRALLRLGIELSDLEGHVGEESDRAEAALRYLERRLGKKTALTPLTTQSTTPATGRLFDPDPAVIAARLERETPTTLKDGWGAPIPAELALYLGDAHEALRRAAAERLHAMRRGSDKLRALELAALWLEEPRIPHATRSVVELLDRSREIDDLLAFAWDNIDARPGLATWAISYIANAELWEDEHTAALVKAATSQGLVRQTAIAAIGRWRRRLDACDQVEARAILVRALSDDDDAVRRIAMHALVISDPLDEAVLDHIREDEPALITRLAVTITTDEARLFEYTTDPDPATRAHALGRLHRFRCLPRHLLERSRSHPDPWIRAAVLDADNALDVLVNDADPRLKRAAFEVAARSPRALEAARVAHAFEDPWLRARAADCLSRSRDEADLVLVLRLSRDPELSVRAAAANVIERSRADLHERLLRIIDRADLGDDDLARRAAETWLGIRAPRVIATHLYETKPATPTPITTIGDDEERAIEDSPAHLNKRLLARDLWIAPLVLSGANEPSVASLFRATNQGGCNAVFWEPRYRNLSTFLRTRRSAQPLVIAGTYHATARAIRRDVEQALRRIKRDVLDVFLVFWVRSPARLRDEVPEVMERLRGEGLVRAIGFSTHDRELAREHAKAPWDVMMVRHSAAHPGAEEHLFPTAKTRGIGVLAFSATSYSRLLKRKLDDIKPPTAAECYRYSLSQPGVVACVSAPRGGRELIENLGVIADPHLSDGRMREIRRHGQAAREEALDFGGHIRRFPALPDEIARLENLEEEATSHLPFDP